MEPESFEIDRRLSQIQTRWSVIFRAHEGPAEVAQAAQRALMERYGGAVQRYLLGLVGDADAAEDLAQEFALRFLRGDFRHADSARGRFRDFVKQALRNLAVDHARRRRARPRSGGDATPEPAADDPGPFELDRQFLSCWRQGLMDRAWQGLVEHQARTGQPYHTVLLLRAENPDLHSPQLAERLTMALGREVGAGWVEQTLHLARERYGDLLLEEVASSLDAPTADAVEQELIDLELLESCRRGLDRLRGRP